MAGFPHIKVSLYKDDGSNANEYGFELRIKYRDSPIEDLTISDPYTVDREAIVRLQKEQKGSISGGGNSYWQLANVDGKYKITYDISGCGGDSSITIVLPNEQTDMLLSVWYDLLFYSKNIDREKFIEQVEAVNCVVEWI